MSLLPKVFPRNQADRQAQIERDFIRQEAKIGGGLFGELPPGRQRQFFCLDERTWIWHEQWKDAQGTHAITTRYEVRPEGVLKLQDGKPYQRLSPEEADNFHRTVGLYRQKVGAYYQRILQAA